MAIIWLIIKIILFVLLGIIGLVILLLLGVLFLPITYRAKVLKLKDTQITAYSKIFKIIGVEYIQNEKENYLKITVFGIKVFLNDLNSDMLSDNSKKENETFTKSVHQNKETTQPTVKASEIKVEKSVVENEKQIEIEVQGKTVKSPKNIKEDKVKPQKTKTKKVKLKKTKEKNSNKQKVSFFLKQAKEFWDSKHRPETIRAIKKCIGAILKTVKPKTLYFDITIGREDPSDTGQLIAKLALFYPLYYRYGIVNGNYEEEGFWGKITTSGAFNIYHIVKPIVILLLNNSVRAYIKLILNSRKDDKHGNKA